MRVDIGNKIKFDFDGNEITMPKASGSYYLAREIFGRGQLLEAHFKFNTDKVFFLLEADGATFIDLDVDDYNTFCGFKGNDDLFSLKHSVAFDDDEKMLHIRFDLPFQYSGGLRFYVKSNDGNKAKKLEGFNIITNSEAE
tara:strand:+ start:269 stop:688 length:420 start_codon:yes stop_codon:yes gene_type:complete